MYGLGIVKGLATTLRHFFETYIDDLRWLGKGRYRTPQGILHRSSKNVRGLFTIQYPEEKLPVPEEFRYTPFLVYEDGPNGEKLDRCTACGICAKVCPPQCIWIVRTSDPATGRPVPTPAEFYIDTDICMNCGLCAEFCPFDAIKMDHDYEIASYDRRTAHIFDKHKLSRPVSYYAGIRPVNCAREEAARKEKEARKAKAQAPA
jgi:NADH-quinone oxidoreductase subunit I